MICPSAADTNQELFVRHRQLKAAATETEKLRVAGDNYKRELLQQKLSDTEWALSREQDRAKEAEAEKDGAATAAHCHSTKEMLGLQQDCKSIHKRTDSGEMRWSASPCGQSPWEDRESEWHAEDVSAVQLFCLHLHHDRRLLQRCRRKL